MRARRNLIAPLLVIAIVAMAWIGLGIVTFVALRMIWDGSAQIMHQTAMLNLLG